MNFDEREDLEKLPAIELKKIAREVAKTFGFPSSPIIALTKEDLIETILQHRLVTGGSTVPTGGNGNGHDDLADVIAKAISGKVGVNTDQIIDDVMRSVDDRLNDFVNNFNHIEPTKIQINDGPVKDMGLQHKLFADIMALIANNIDVMLVGPAGSGKTTACHSIATAMDLPFYFMSFCAQSTKSDLLGYMDANGRYVDTPLRKAYEHGGVLLGDEIDNGNAGILNVLNGLLDNGIASFPDRQVERHPNFHFICSANTYGLGGDIQYVGRNQLDAAFRDRFVTLEFGYDDDLEASFTGNTNWLKRVRSIRNATLELKEKVVVSPRATIKGSALLAMGWSQERVEEAVIFKGCNRSIKTRILENAR